MRPPKNDPRFPLSLMLAPWCLVVSLLLWVSAVPAQELLPRPQVGRPMAVVDLEHILRELPPGERWLKHAQDDLIAFWTMEAALGEPLGNFPTYRANDGSAIDPNAPPAELANADSTIVRLDRDYIRAKSRQTYGYGVAYHLTGDEKLLRYAQAGADWLIANALDQENGGAYSWLHGQERCPEPEVEQRTSQDLAYAASGIAFFYYLTRDEKYLKHVVDIKRHVWEHYFDESTGLLRWVNQKTKDGDSPSQKELVSQLDQVYGYMLWTVMALPEGKLRTRWERDLQMLARAMRNQFFSDRNGLYWGRISDTGKRNLGIAHTDFGHSIKTLWLTYRIGLLTGDQALVEFAKPQMTDIINRAFIPETGSWARGYKRDPAGSQWVLDCDKEWWSLCELDQTTATIALVDPAYAAYLTRTYDYWFRHLVDHKYHGIWHMVLAAGDVPDKTIPKQHSWKNCFHVFEHALVGYVTTQQLHDKPAQLYFAFKQRPSRLRSVQPYVFFGRVDTNKTSCNPFKASELKDYQSTIVEFTDIR